MLATAVLCAALAMPKLAVLPFRSEQASAELTIFAAEHLAQTLQERGFEVVTPQDVTTLVAESALAECSPAQQPACLGPLATALGVPALITGTLVKQASVLTLEVQVRDAQSGKTLAAARSEASQERQYQGLVAAVADALEGQLKHGPGRATTGPGARLWVPLAAGAVVAAGGGALLGVAVSQVEDLTRAPKAGAPRLDYLVARQQFRDAATLRTSGLTLMGLGAAVAVMGVVLTLTAPVAVVPTFTNQQVGLTLTGALP
jgi:TolB-like protein